MRARRRRCATRCRRARSRWPPESIASLRFDNCSLRYRDRALVQELRKIEQRCERIEGTEHQELLQIEASVDERDEVALLRREVEAVEVCQEVRAQLRHDLNPFRMREKVAH